MAMKQRVCSVLFVGLLLPACGDDAQTVTGDGGTDAAACTTARADRYLPLAVGATWTFRVTPLTGTAVTKTSTVEAIEDVGGSKAGISAFRVRTGKIDGATVSWQEDRCTSITRHREKTFDLANLQQVDTFYVPDKIRIDETAAHVALGATWPVTYSEVTTDAANVTTMIAKDETWTVEAIAESVTVPAGTFTALKLHKVTSGAADKRFWFVKGVGKVKETGDQTEELMSYTLP
jgi:hypothetical protein